MSGTNCRAARWGVLFAFSLAVSGLFSGVNAQEPRMVRDINVGPLGSLPLFLTEVDGMLFFTANDGMRGFELWRSAGTEDGTILVKDVHLGPMSGFSSANSPNFTRVNGALFFRADDGSTGFELWRSDGTENGTALVRDIVPGPESGFVGLPQLTAVNGSLFFRADDGMNGRELWRSDGTQMGTMLLKDIKVGAEGSVPGDLTAVGRTLFFRADDGEVGPELWKSDGTLGGTTLVRDIHRGRDGSTPRSFLEVDGVLFFTADDGITGSELWKSDGTEAGTVPIKDLNPGPPGSEPFLLAAIDGVVYFSANDGAIGTELWRSDGSELGTVPVKDVLLGPESGIGGVPQTAVANDLLFFSADDGVSGNELWVTDGTEVGTMRVKDIAPGFSGSNPDFLRTIDETLYFSADDGQTGFELWKSDGTPSGTQQIVDLNPGIGGSGPVFLTNVDHTLFFNADDGDHGRELWILLPEFENFTCDAQVGQIVLSWSLLGTAGAIEIERNGEVIATVSGAETSFVDDAPPAGNSQYELIARNVAVRTPSGICKAGPADSFLRGDCDGNGSFQGLPDAVFSLSFQFAMGSPPLCLEACDVDANGIYQGLPDSVFILNCQFAPGSPCPPPPFPRCGLDPDPATTLGCAPNACP